MGILEKFRTWESRGIGGFGMSSCNLVVVESSSSSSESSIAVISAAVRFREDLGLLLEIASNFGEQLWDLKHEE